MQIVIYLLFANAVMHIVSFGFLHNQKAPNRMGVFAFACINAVIAVFLMQGVFWVKWLALISPTIGFTGLFLTLKKSTAPKIVDYTILGLDIAVIVFMVKELFVA